jgi:hypothetical protein
MPRQIIHKGDMYRISPENGAWIDKNPGADGKGWIKILTGSKSTFPFEFEDLIDAGHAVFATTRDEQGNRHQVVSLTNLMGWSRQWL